MKVVADFFTLCGAHQRRDLGEVAGGPLERWSLPLRNPLDDFLSRLAEAPVGPSSLGQREFMLTGRRPSRDFDGVIATYLEVNRA